MSHMWGKGIRLSRIGVKRSIVEQPDAHDDDGDGVPEDDRIMELLEDTRFFTADSLTVIAASYDFRSKRTVFDKGEVFLPAKSPAQVWYIAAGSLCVRHRLDEDTAATATDEDFDSHRIERHTLIGERQLVMGQRFASGLVAAEDGTELVLVMLKEFFDLNVVLDDQIINTINVWHTFDLEHCGLNIAQLGEFLEKGVKVGRPPEAELAIVFKALDFNHNGYVQLSDVLKMLVDNGGRKKAAEPFEFEKYRKCCCWFGFPTSDNEADFRGFYGEKEADAYVQSLAVLCFFTLLELVVKLCRQVVEGKAITFGQSSQDSLLLVGVLPITLAVVLTRIFRDRACVGPAWQVFKEHFEHAQLLVSLPVCVLIILAGTPELHHQAQTGRGSNWLGAFKLVVYCFGFGKMRVSNSWIVFGSTLVFYQWYIMFFQILQNSENYVHHSSMYVLGFLKPGDAYSTQSIMVLWLVVVGLLHSCNVQAEKRSRNAFIRASELNHEERMNHDQALAATTTMFKATDTISGGAAEKISPPNSPVDALANEDLSSDGLDQPHSVDELAQELLDTGNSFISGWTARFKEAHREKDFLHQRIMNEKWTLFRKFVMILCASAVNAGLMLLSGMPGLSQLFMGCATFPALAAVVFGGENSRAIWACSILSISLLVLISFEVQVWHSLGVDELDAGTNTKTVLTTMFVMIFGVFGLSTLTFPEKVLLNVAGALSFFAVSMTYRDIFYDATRACPECDRCCGRWTTADDTWSLRLLPEDVVVLLAQMIVCGGTNAYRTARAQRRGAAAAKIRALQVEQAKMAVQDMRRRSETIGSRRPSERKSRTSVRKSILVEAPSRQAADVTLLSPRLARK